MGTCESKGTKKLEYDVNNQKNNAHVMSYRNIYELQEELDRAVKMPLELAVCHYTPSTFPLVPVVTKRTTKLCSDSWDQILGNSTESDDVGNSVSGMTEFYVEFYNRLDEVDTSGKFEAVLGRHTSSGNNIAAKGAILIRIIRFVLSLDNSEQSEVKLHMLGKSHAQKAIRPWQYSIFIQTLLNTISSRLQTKATGDVMEAWVNLFAFVMRSMLPLAIKGQVIETELNINTSSEFATGKVAEEVQEQEAIREMNKRFNNSHGTSKYGSRYDSRISIGLLPEHNQKWQAELLHRARIVMRMRDKTIRFSGLFDRI